MADRAHARVRGGSRRTPKVARDINNPGGLLRTPGRSGRRPRAAYEPALAIDEKSFGPDHRNVARDVHNLGSVLQDLSDVAGARAVFERALCILEKSLPADPRTSRRRTRTCAASWSSSAPPRAR